MRSFDIFFHGLAEILAYFIGFRYYLYLKSKQGDTLSSEKRAAIFIAGLSGALVGSRVLALWENYQLFLGTTHPWVFIISNKTILGGLLGGLIAIELAKKLVGVKNSTGDLITFPLIVGMIIGRIGCFSAGIADHTYGIATRLPWGMDLGDGIRRHPTNLYEIIFLVCVFVLLRVFIKKIRPIDGLTFAIFFMSYLVFRFFIEFIKPEPVVFMGLSAIQVAAVGGIAYYAFTLPKILSRKIYA